MSWNLVLAHIFADALQYASGDAFLLVVLFDEIGIYHDDGKGTHEYS